MSNKDMKKPTVVGGVNLSTRVRSKTFWVSLVGILVGVVTQVGTLFGLDLEDQVGQYSELATGIITALGILGVLQDPNTKGIKDSGIAQTYTSRRDSKDPEQAIDWQNNTEFDLGVKKPQEFDTSESFSDDSDEEVVDLEEEVAKDDSVQEDTNKPLGAGKGESVDSMKNTPLNVGSQSAKSKGGEK